MRKISLSLTILLVALSSQRSFSRTSDPFGANSSQMIVQEIPQKKLASETIPQIKVECIESVKASIDSRLRKLSDQLMHSFPATNSFGLELQRAEALLACKSASNAQNVLLGISPVNGSQLKKWSILFWEASNALMDHPNASLALRRLSRGNLETLDQELITVGYRSDGSRLQRFALDLLAEHERLSDRCEAASKVLLAGRKSGALGAKRLSRAVQCLEGLSTDKRKDVLESALVEAKSDEAWWLVGDILRLRLMLDLSIGEDSTSTRNRLENFAKELDDRYTQLELIHLDSDREEEKTLLQNQLRSPRGKTSDDSQAPI